MPLQLLTKIKLIPFFTPKIPSRMIETSQIRASYNMWNTRTKITELQPIQLQNIIRNLLVPRQCVSFNLHTTAKLLLVGKEYICFQIDGKSIQAARCFKSRIINKAVNYGIYIDTFEQQCVVINGMLQLLCLTYHINTMGIDQSLSNIDLFEHIYF